LRTPVYLKTVSQHPQRIGIGSCQRFFSLNFFVNHYMNTTYLNLQKLCLIFNMAIIVVYDFKLNKCLSLCLTWFAYTLFSLSSKKLIWLKQKFENIHFYQIHNYPYRKKFRTMESMESMYINITLQTWWINWMIACFSCKEGFDGDNIKDASLVFKIWIWCNLYGHT